MMRGEAGGIAVHLLGSSLLLLLLVGGMGLAEGARASLVKTQATRAVVAAVESAARQAPADAEATFRAVLRANLGSETAYEVSFQPVTHFDRPALVGQVVLEYRLAYLGRWLPAVPLKVSHTALIGNRKPPDR